MPTGVGSAEHVGKLARFRSGSSAAGRLCPLRVTDVTDPRSVRKIFGKIWRAVAAAAALEIEHHIL